MTSVLVVDKSYDTRELYYDIFCVAGYRCFLATDGLEAMDVFRRERPELVVTGLSVQIVGGLDLLRHVRQKDPDAAIIVVGTPLTSVDKAAECYRLGAFKLLRRPVHVDELLIYAERALERRQLLIERRQRAAIPPNVKLHVRPSAMYAKPSAGGFLEMSK
jgi:DNA-binding NtrC family response regulator